VPPLRIAESCFGLAHLRLRHFDRLDEAEPFYARAVANLENNMPADDAYLVTIMYEYAQLLFELDREEEARALEERIPAGAVSSIQAPH